MTNAVSFVSSNYNWTIYGDIDLSAGSYAHSWSKGTGTITLSGSNAQSINFDGETVEDIVVNKTAGTVTMAGNVTTDSLELTRGTWDANSKAIDVSGAVTSNPTAGAVTVQDTGTSGTLSITGNIDLNGTATYGITWNDLDIDTLGGATREASYATVSNSNNSTGNSITVTNGTDSGGNTGWDFGGAPTLSAATVTNIQSTSATVGCTVTF